MNGAIIAAAAYAAQQAAENERVMAETYRQMKSDRHVDAAMEGLGYRKRYHFSGGMDYDVCLPDAEFKSYYWWHRPGYYAMWLGILYFIVAGFLEIFTTVSWFGFIPFVLGIVFIVIGGVWWYSAWGRYQYEIRGMGYNPIRVDRVDGSKIPDGYKSIAVKHERLNSWHTWEKK